MSCAVFKDEIWTFKVKPSHKVIAARGRHMEVVGYFVAHTADEVQIAIEVFDAEYGASNDRLMAVKIESVQPEVVVLKRA